MKNYKLLIIEILLVVLTACKKKGIDQQAETQKLMELSKSWAQSVKDKDVEAMLSYWADDAILISLANTVDNACASSLRPCQFGVYLQC